MSAALYCAHCGALNQSQAAICFACGRSLTEPASPASDARRLIRGRYRVVRQLGVGGFGAVYQAEDTSLGNRLVAIKEMSPRGLKPDEAREATEAFQREALLLAGLAHPNLPRLYERFEEEGRWYLVMDFIEGQTLDVYLDKKGGRLPVKEALWLTVQLTEVLGYLHSRQPPIIFRDLKPSNVIRTPEGQLVLVDFGIARLFKPGQSKDTIAFGSPGYAAPEQYGKAQTTPRSDVFSLGVLLHQMLTGLDPSDKPFRFAPLTMPRPAGLSALIERMVDMDESKRPPSMEIIRRELERLIDERTPWSADETAFRAALFSSVGQSIGIRAGGGPVAQPTSYTPPFQPRATPQKSKSNGWVIALVGIMLCVGIPAIAGVVAFLHSSYSTRVLEDPIPTKDGYSYTPVAQSTTSTNGSATAPPPATPPATPTATPSGPAVPVYSVAWSPDGTRVASGGADGKIAIWDATTGASMLTLHPDFANVNTLAWSPDSRYLAAAGDKGELQIWNNIGSDEGIYPIASSGITSLSWSPDNEHIALASSDGMVQVVDTVTASENSIAQSSHGVNAVAWSPNGQYLAFGGLDQTVQVWDYTQDAAAFTYRGHSGAIDAIAWSPDGTRIASSGGDNTIQTWDALTGANSFTYPGVGSVALAWSPNAMYLASAATHPQVWLIARANPLFVYDVQYYTKTIAWSSDSQRIASSGYDGTVQIWNALTGANVVTCRQP